MCLSCFLRSQFGSPSGLFGSLFVAPFLNATNMAFIRTSVELLGLKPDDRVLDIGFGGGYSLLALAERIPNGQVVGVDHSRDMVDAAARVSPSTWRPCQKAWRPSRKKSNFAALCASCH